MNDNKNLFDYLSEWQHARQEKQQTTPRTPSRWLPSPGNVIFTLVMVALLILTQRTWASNSQSANTPGSSTTTINYQGRLADDAGNPQTGTLGMSFAIWDAANGGGIIWGPESHSAVPVTDGLFNVGLGSQTSGGIPTTVWNGDRYLEITVSGETLTPRELIRSVPIAGMALTVPDGAINTTHLVNGSVTEQKLDPSITFLQLQNGRKVASTETPGWGLHQGNGTRTYTTHVTFDQAFDATPSVAVSLSSIDTGGLGGINTRINVYATNIIETGFDLNFQTWADSLVYGISVTWLAYAEQ